MAFFLLRHIANRKAGNQAHQAAALLQALRCAADVLLQLQRLDFDFDHSYTVIHK